MNTGFRLSLGIEAGWLKFIPASYILPLWIRYLKKLFRWVIGLKEVLFAFAPMNKQPGFLSVATRAFLVRPLPSKGTHLDLAPLLSLA